MAETKLTERIIQTLASATSFQRGKEYFQSRAVVGLVQRGETLRAQVEGSEYDPYDVTVRLYQGGVAGAECSCPYDWGGYCKHIVAVLLAYVRDPAAVARREPVAALLQELDRAQLLGLLTGLVESSPHLADRIECELAVSPVSAGDEARTQPVASRRTLVDPAPIRNRAQRILRDSGRRRGYWDGYESSGDPDELRKLVESAVPFLEASDGRNALRVLEPIADTFVQEWTHYYYDHDETLYLVFNDLGNLFAEAILSADLSAEERRDWAEILQGWQSELDEYGVDDAFWVAIGAAEQGWDDPGLQRVLQGTARERSWKRDDRWDDDRLTKARLRVLECQDRNGEYLNLALATGSRTHYATMLVRLERVDEAVSYGQREFEWPREALDLAKTLQDREAHQKALEVAESGLGLAGRDQYDWKTSVVPLAHWLRDFAAGLGDTELAFRASRAAYDESLSLEDYQSVEQWAGEKWADTRPELLERLASVDNAYDRTRIYLHEGMVDEAVRSVGDPGFNRALDNTLLRVADAAYESHPHWVIKVSRKQAEWIMNEGKARFYDTAAQWLEKAKLAFVAADMEHEWGAYLEGLIHAHTRKYKLRPLLEKLR